MNQFILGAIGMAAAVAGLFFFNFWRITRDRFFLFFAFSFWIQALDRLVVGFANAPNEDKPEFYLIRLVAYALILVGVYDKNQKTLRSTA